MSKIGLMLVIALLFAGCSQKQSTGYPVKKMVDPVTEEGPNVILP